MLIFNIVPEIINEFKKLSDNYKGDKNEETQLRKGVDNFCQRRDMEKVCNAQKGQKTSWA